ncbi:MULTISPECIES: GGDEF domain-containing protein [unclassified Duganella]|uniref:GGDEF domain-containing protein n=1 Tax=unclassified Duganella TaxID=2636909 RepID=UPI000E348095|nr:MULTISPECIES: GGDEF domain-containing protein [unclassified Duganella]RFP14800.1 GGDEF domain-containing protein [Duganella sp. BJB475]RFP31149.1 GGDEF domain-containing protein [Duganella sp. BJB476]
MSSKPSTPEQNPAEIAREAFKRLAVRRIAPTPEAYRDIYNEIAGVTAAPAAPIGAVDPGPESVLSQFATRLTENTGDLADFGRRFNRAVKSRDWEGYAKALSQLVEKHFVGKKGGIEVAGLLPEDEQSRTLRDLLSRTLTFAVASLLAGAPVLVAEAESLGAATKLAHSEEALAEIAVRLKQLCYQIELRGGDSGEQQELLLRLFKLLLENVSELLDDDSWLRGQIESVQNLITGPIDVRALEEATRSLKEVIYKQGQLKHSLSDVKLTVKNMMMTFIDRLGQVAASTGDFHEKIGGYSEKISKADNIAELNTILDDVLKETRLVQSEALKARDKMVLARQEVQDAENRIHALEAKLQHLSELVREDQLTGSLNRRGLDDVFERETARADRRGTPLCIAILDLDDFKKLNDTYGHIAGDAALKHLVKIVKDTLRSMDVIARFGGEEFLILMPETSVEAASSTMTRLQRELTKHFFLHDNEKVLITFSAGVALRRPNEEQTELVKRADKAMYTAKQTGKNRVVVAE